MKTKDKLISEDIEISVIGCMILDDAEYISSQIKSPRAFAFRENRIIANTILEMQKKGEFIDKSTLLTRIRNEHDLKDEASFENRIRKSINFAEKEKVNEHLLVLNDLHFRRESIEKLHDSIALAGQLSVERKDIENSIEKIIDDSSSSQRSVARTPDEIINGESEKYRTLETGSPELDKFLYKKLGRHTGTTELILARSGHGKTFYAIKKQAYFCMKGAKGVHFSLEDIDTETALIAKSYLVDKNHSSNLFIADDVNDLSEIIRMIRYYKRKNSIDFFCVDHMLLVNNDMTSETNEFRVQEKTSRALTRVSKELDVHGIICTQTKKMDETAKGWKNAPTLANLWGANGVINDAFVITGLFRPNQYRELRVGDEEFVLDAFGNKEHYDSVFAYALKNKRQKLTGQMLQMIHTDSGLLFVREYTKSRTEQAPF